MIPLRPFPGRLARWLLLAAVLLGCLWPALAAFRSRTERFDVQSWNRDDGLPDNAAERLLVTRDGWLWIGTRSGLARFDGLKFTVYDAATPGFTDDAILDLAEDTEGSLWIATKQVSECGGKVHRRGQARRTWITARAAPADSCQMVN